MGLSSRQNKLEIHHLELLDTQRNSDSRPFISDMTLGKLCINTRSLSNIA